MSLLKLTVGVLLLTASLFGAELPEPSPAKLPRWRGFNLLEKLDRDNPSWNRAYFEDDFRWISEFGFNFVRLPMDYRIWIKNKDWEQIDESAFADIDQAIAWGRQYGLHVSINFHRAPGYKVNDRTERLNLWKDAEAQRICATHWAFFARRYRDIPSRNLSFNLFNEPPRLEPENYLQVVALMVEAIREQDPDRLIIADGLMSGNRPVPQLKNLKIAQAGRGYLPPRITFYGIDWVPGSKNWPLPTQWPPADPPPYLFGSMKRRWQGPQTLLGDFPPGTHLRFHVDEVSVSAELRIKADGAVLLEKDLVCGPDEKNWKKVVYNEKFKTYQNQLDQDFRVDLEEAAKKIEFEIGRGDWLKYSEIGITLPNQRESILRTYGEKFGIKPGVITLNGRGLPDGNSPVDQSGAEVIAELMTPWKELSDQGVGVMIGEWGAYNRTPHSVVLAWMEDCLDYWRKEEWGWALWSFRGSFGILDSGRSDVQYEDFHGHKLDSEMLKLLQSK